MRSRYRYRSNRRGPSFLTVLLLLIILAAAALFLLQRFNVIDLFPSRTDTVATEATKTFTLRDIGKLATQEAIMTRVHSESDARQLFGITWPGTERRLVFSYDVTVKAGLDFEKVKVTANTAAKTVRISLPSVGILDASLDTDSFQVYDETKNIFNRVGVSYFNKAISTMLAEGKEYAVAHGLLERARDNAELLITGFLGQTYPMSEYTYSFDWEDEIL